jgi:hypothetical protein
MDDDDTADSANDDAADDDAADGESSSEGGSSTGVQLGTVSGIVRRTSEIGPEDDGIGTLYVAAFAECDHAGQIVGVFVLPEADLSQAENEIPFVLENLTLDTVYLASFLDDDGNADPAGPLPDLGDPVLADDVEDGLLTCVEVDVTNGSNVVVELNALED